MTVGPGHWQRCVDSWQSAGRLPGVVAGVLRGGELVWTGSAGRVAGAAEHVQHRIGSITKTFVAVLVLQLRDEGLVSLDDTLGQHVEGAPYAEATLRELLSHTSGMQSEPTGSWWERSAGAGWDELVAANDGSGRIAEAGSHFHYSNLGFALLGELVARLRGEPWWDVVRHRLLDPLGMTRTTYLPEAPHAQGRSVHHFLETLTDEPHQDTGAMAPAGQAWSTVADLARWGRFLGLGDPAVLRLDTLREMAVPLTPDEGYGLGLRTATLGERVFAGHTGSMPGFLASLLVEQGNGDGVVVLCNATTGLATDAQPLDLLGDRDVTATAPWVPSEVVPPVVAEIAGLWFWGNTAQELHWRGGVLELHPPGDRHDPEVFTVDGDAIVGLAGYHRGETLHVVRRADGSVSHLVCATFVYTRVPYDAGVPIPGGHPA